MTRWLNKSQREFLIQEYMEQLEEFDQLDEYGDMDKVLRSCDNNEFYQLVIEFMPIYDEPGMIQKMMKRAGK